MRGSQWLSSRLNVSILPRSYTRMIASTFLYGLAAMRVADCCRTGEVVETCASSPPFFNIFTPISLPQLEILSALQLEWIEAKLPLLPNLAPLRESASVNAASPSWVSMTVVVQLFTSGSGGRHTRVRIWGTNSLKWRETKVETRLDFPTPSV